MAHEITEREDGISEAMFAGQKPWHGLGEMLEDKQTPTEALKIAHLDWTVEKREIKYAIEKIVDEDGSLGTVLAGDINDRFANVRTDNDCYLGVVGGKYTPVQNWEQADFIEALTGEGGAVVECAGSLFNGRKTFWTCRLPEDIVIDDDDKMNKYLIIANDHGGRGSFTAYFTTTRVVCNNTLQLSQNAMENRISIRHTGDIRSKIEEAKMVLGIGQERYEAAEENYKALATLQINPEHVNDLLMSSFGLDDKSRKSTMEGIMDSYAEEQAISKNPDSAWTLYNGVTRYTTHVMGTDDSRRFDSLLSGKGSRVNAEAMGIIQRAGTPIVAV